MDSSSNVYVSDYANHKIRKLTTSGVTTFAGDISGFGDGTGTNTNFYNPAGITYDEAGKRFYVADRNNHRIRAITSTGSVSTYAGDTTSGSIDGARLNAKFNNPVAVAVTPDGNYVYIVDNGNHRIRLVDYTGACTTVAGSSAGLMNGYGTNALFNGPGGIAMDPDGNLYIGDTGNDVIRKINPFTGLVSTLAGPGSTNPIGESAQLTGPTSLVWFKNGMMVSSSNGDLVKFVHAANGFTIRLLGSGTGHVDGIGTSAAFNVPMGLAIDKNKGNVVYLADQGSNYIRKITVPGD